MFLVRREARVTAARRRQDAPVACAEPGCGALVLWAERAGRRRAGGPARGGLPFAFYGRVSTEDWQDPESSRVRQREQAESLVRGTGASRRSSSMSGRAGRWRGRGARRPPPGAPG